MKRLILCCCASMATFGSLAAPAIAAPSSSPPTLTGEAFSASGGPTSVTCTLDSLNGTFAFTASGTASGPYNGTFQESGSGTVDRSSPETLTAFSASFTINALDGSTTVTGTTALAPSTPTPVPCQQVGTTLLTTTSAPTTYQATIYTAAGNYRDQGTAPVQSLWTSSAGGTSLDESFASALKQPKRTNK